METPIPPHHDTEEDVTPISRGGSQTFVQPKDNVRLHNTETLPLNMFPKYYVRRKNKLPKRITQTLQLLALEEEATSQQDDPCEEEILPIALRKGTRACVKPLPHSIVNIMNYRKNTQLLPHFLTTYSCKSTSVPTLEKDSG